MALPTRWTSSVPAGTGTAEWVARAPRADVPITDGWRDPWVVWLAERDLRLEVDWLNGTGYVMRGHWARRLNIDLWRYNREIAIQEILLADAELPLVISPETLYDVHRITAGDLGIVLPRWQELSTSEKFKWQRNADEQNASDRKDPQ